MVLNPNLVRHWQPIIRAFDPHKPLSTTEINTLYVEREGSPGRSIAEDLLYDEDADRLFVMCGSRGSGKSTEIARLTESLQHTRVVVRLDLSTALPEPHSTVGLVIVIGLAALRAHEAWKGDTATHKRITQGLETALQGLLNEQEPTQRKLNISDLVASTAGVVAVYSPEPISKVIAATAAGVAKASQLAWTPGLGKSALDAPDQVSLNILNAVNTALEALTTASGRKPLILADGLDKLTELESLIQVLNRPQLLNDLATPLVLTAPINLMHSTEFNAVRQYAETVPLYNLPVVNPDDDTKLGTGYANLREVFAFRKKHHSLTQHWLEDSALNLLIRFSGGSIRDFIGLIRDAAKHASRAGKTTIDDDHAQEAIRELRHRLQFPLTEASITLLRSVLTKGIPPGGEEAANLLFQNYILCYPNGDIWYRPHEVLVQWLRQHTPLP